MTQLPPARNFIDELVFKQLKQLGVPPSPVCDDATFLRRVTLDIAGRLPTLEETNVFLANKDAARYEQLVDRLLAGPDYADYAASKWSAILRNRRKTPQEHRSVGRLWGDEQRVLDSELVMQRTHVDKVGFSARGREAQLHCRVLAEAANGPTA